MYSGRGAALCLGAFVCAFMLIFDASAALAARRDKALETRLLRHIEVLASDEFEGREPGTEGEARTLRYLARQWFDIGLVSGTNEPGNEWFAPVFLVARTPASSSAQFMRRGRKIDVAPEAVLLITSGKRSLVSDSPLLFVGRGTETAFSRNDLAGRVAVLLEAGIEDGERQDALLAAGASAVLTILDGDRTLDQIAARRKRSGYALANDSLGGDLEGFISTETMKILLAGTRTSLDDLRHEAEAQRFAPRLLGLTASLEATTRETTIRTHNLIGKLPGRRADVGAVLVVSHWDHFGICGEPSAEDRICNGAVDNASGLAALTEIARRLTRGRRLDRDVYFLATTAEELGLLGAHAFAENPPVPLDQFVAAFNIDSVALAPRRTPLAIVGKGLSGLDEQILLVAGQEKRRVVEDEEEIDDFVRRQDGWALLQHDIPAVMVTSTYGNPRLMRRFFETRYHRPDDDLSHRIELGGAAEDVAFHVALVRWFANLERVPQQGE